jgi:hypothetical protein
MSADLLDLEVKATPYLDHVLIEVLTGFSSGFTQVSVECSDDRTTWEAVPDSTATILPGGATGIWFDFTHRPTQDPKRWYRARVGDQRTALVSVRP